jgi:UDP-glucose 4-epimerase
MADRVLISGGTGFVGRSLAIRLAEDPRYLPVAAVRRQGTGMAPGVQPCLVGELGPDTDWGSALAGVDAVVHCAARVHVLKESAADPLAAFRRVNVAGTLRLAQQAARSGVRRFIFLSSIGVHGAETFGLPFTAGSRAAPHSPYAVSKHEAEVALRRLARETGLEVVIIRPPLVYGPNAPGNFSTLLRLVFHGLPLPLGAIRNRRSLVALDNLVDLLVTCIDHPAAANQAFLVSDGEDLSTPALLQRTALALGRPARLVPVPSSLVRGVARLLGKEEVGQQLCGSLQADIGKTRELLGWVPLLSVEAALARTARHFLQSRRR